MATIAGTERVISNKINYLSEKGYNISLITYEQGNHPLAFDLNKSVRIYDIGTRFFTLGKYNIINKYFRFLKLKFIFKNKLDCIIKEIKPDIIICTTYSIKLANDILYIANKYNSKTIIESHVALFSIMRHYDFRKTDIKYYLTYIQDYKAINCIKKFDALVVLTNGDAKAWSKYKKANVIPNIINDSSYIKDEKNNLYYRIISVGRLDIQKGYDLLIKAFSIIYNKYKPWRIDIFGNGSERDKLINSIKELNMEKAINIKDPQKNIYDEYHKSDFFVMSSRYEGFGLVLAEAMSCGIPVIAFDCPYGPNEIISDRYDGIIVKNGDINDLASKIEWMIIHDKERLKMGINASKSAKRYNKDTIMKCWIDLFSEILTR